MNKSNITSKIISELNYEITDEENYISQSDYRDKMLKTVEPFLKENLKKGYISGMNNIKLYYESFILKNSIGNIVICHGFSEFTEKYYELIYYFIRENYSVFIIEHRGHGRSQRLGIDDFQINVEKFDYYVEDFKKFLDEIVMPQSNNKKLFMFAHSMGGGIGTVFLEQYPNYFDAAVLSSPMHGINTGKVPKIIANGLSRCMKICGMGKKYLPGQAPYSGKKSFPNRSTSCRERHDFIKEKVEMNKEFQSGGSSALWYIEGLKATKKLLRKENASKIKIPIILFQAEHETHVIPEANNKFKLHAKNCELILIKGGRHELYYESDEIMYYYLKRVLGFYRQNL